MEINDLRDLFRPSVHPPSLTIRRDKSALAKDSTFSLPHLPLSLARISKNKRMSASHEPQYHTSVGTQV